jgi:hypothetical protein
LLSCPDLEIAATGIPGFVNATSMPPARFLDNAVVRDDSAMSASDSVILQQS